MINKLGLICRQVMKNFCRSDKKNWADEIINNTCKSCEQVLNQSWKSCAENIRD